MTPTGSADIGIAASEYSGLSTVTDAIGASINQRPATGTTGGAATVSSGATAATTSGNELALGVYVDSGFGDTLTARLAATRSARTSPTSATWRS